MDNEYPGLCFAYPTAGYHRSVEGKQAFCPDCGIVVRAVPKIEYGSSLGKGKPSLLTRPIKPTEE